MLNIIQKLIKNVLDFEVNLAQGKLPILQVNHKHLFILANSGLL